MVKTNIEREKMRTRIGDAVEDQKPNESKSEGSKTDKYTPGNQQTQAPDVVIPKPNDNEETSESPSKKVRFEDEQMEVDSG